MKFNQIFNRPSALAVGFRFYFTGKPCRKGHVAARYTNSGACIDCLRGVPLVPGLAKPPKAKRVTRFSGMTYKQMMAVLEAEDLLK